MPFMRADASPPSRPVTVTVAIPMVIVFAVMETVEAVDMALFKLIEASVTSSDSREDDDVLWWSHRTR